MPAYHANLTAPADSAPGNPLLRRGGTDMINVVALRRDGFEGEINVSLEGLPAGVTAGAALIPAGQNSTTIVLRAAEDAPRFAGPIRVLGKATVDGREVTRLARPASVQWPSPVNTPPDSRLARDLWLAVLDLDVAPFLAEFGEDKTWEMSCAGKLDIPIKLTRRGEMKQPVTFTAIGLPANVKAAPVTIAPEAAEGKLTLELSDKAAPGIYDLRLQAQASVPYRRDPQSAAAAAAAKQNIEKIAGELAAAAQAADQARQAADKVAGEAATAVKLTADQALAESAKSNRG